MSVSQRKFLKKHRFNIYGFGPNMPSDIEAFFVKRQKFMDSLEKHGVSDNMIPLYHGFRSKLSPEEIRKHGVSTLTNPLDARKEIVYALRFFGKEYLLRSSSQAGQTVRGFIEEMSRSERRSVWVSTFGDRACNWSMRNPEFLSLALRFAGVNDKDIFSYLDRRFGHRYSIKLKLTWPVQTTNSNTGTSFIPGEFIESVSNCDNVPYPARESFLGE